MDGAKKSNWLVLSDRQNHVVAAALSVLSFSVIAAFVAFVVWLGVQALEFSQKTCEPEKTYGNRFMCSTSASAASCVTFTVCTTQNA